MIAFAELDYHQLLYLSLSIRKMVRALCFILRWNNFGSIMHYLSPSQYILSIIFLCLEYILVHAKYFLPLCSSGSKSGMICNPSLFHVSYFIHNCIIYIVVLGYKKLPIKHYVRRETHNWFPRMPMK